MFRFLGFLRQFCADALLMGVTHLPGPSGYAVRRWYWRGRLRHLGQGALIDTGVHFRNPGFIHVGENAWIDKGAVILAGSDASPREKIAVANPAFEGQPGVVHIGANVHVGIGCIVSGIDAGVFIADDCGLAARVQVYAFTHHYRSKAEPSKAVHFGPMAAHERQCLVVGPVQIGENTGVATNALILAGSFIPRNCFVGAGSVVMPGRHAENSVLAGDPARRVRDRFA